jgi:hypothetical protein
MDEMLERYKQLVRIMPQAVGLKYHIRGGSEELDGFVVRFATREDAKLGQKIIPALLPDLDFSWPIVKRGEIKHADEAVTDPMYINIMLRGKNKAGHSQFHKFVQFCENPGARLPAARDAKPMKLYDVKMQEVSVPVDVMVKDKQFDVLSIIETPHEAEDRLRTAARLSLEATDDLHRRN